MNRKELIETFFCKVADGRFFIDGEYRDPIYGCDTIEKMLDEIDFDPCDGCHRQIGAPNCAYGDSPDKCGDRDTRGKKAKKI